MKIAITAILVLFFHVTQAGNIVTFQDYLIVNGDTLVLSNRPLDSYFELYPDLMPEMDEPYTHANNQYTAFFAIEDSTFYLTAIYTDKTDSSSSAGLENLIGSIFNTSEKIRMDWFSSTVIFGTSTLGVNKKVYGKQKHEMFLVAAVSEGQVLSVKTLKAKTLKRMRHQCFKEFSRTPECAELHQKIFHTTVSKPGEFETYLGNRVFDLTSQINKKATLHNNVYDS